MNGWSQAWQRLNNPAWFGPTAGGAITGFVKGALAKTAGDHPDVQAWYAAFLQNVVLPNAQFWSYLVTIGEILVGIALILGIFTRDRGIFWQLYECQLFAGWNGQHKIRFCLYWPHSWFWA